MQKYILIKPYPGRKIGDVAFYDPNINELHFVWEADLKPIPKDFQPDVCDWFELQQAYYQTDKLQQYIDWDAIMKMKRWSGGHDEQMEGLFKSVEVIAHWNDNDYQGQVATCVKFLNGEFEGQYAIYNDYYGSCSGCDAWDGAGDEEVRNMCIGLSNSAFIFKTLDSVLQFLQKPDIYSWVACATNLLNTIKQNFNLF